MSIPNGDLHRRVEDLRPMLFVMAPTFVVFSEWLRRMGIPLGQAVRRLTDRHQLRGVKQPHYVLLPGWDELPYRQVKNILEELAFAQAVELDAEYQPTLRHWMTGVTRTVVDTPGEQG